MARYIDIDKIPFVVGFDAETDEEIVLVTKKQIDAIPTADVVPKSEVKCIYAYDGEVEEYCVQSPCPNYKTIEKANQKVAREIFEEIEQEIELALESNYKSKNGQMMSEHITNEEREFIEYVNGKIHALGGISYFIAELKKKYTESEGKE